MSIISDQIKGAVHTTLNTAWNVQDATTVPRVDDVALSHGAKKVEAAYLYADLAGSSFAAQKLKREVTAKIIRCYINAAVRIIRNKGGHIRSFDGDRVMGIFMGGAFRNDAVRAGLAINWAVDLVLKPKFQAKWPDLLEHYTLNHAVGVDAGEALIVRAGVRDSNDEDNNDLVSVGAAPNVAAKLSELRGTPDIYITRDVYDRLRDPQKYSNGADMWTKYGAVNVGGTSYTVMGSTYRWEP